MSKSKKHPNLVFIVPDEFRPVSMGFLGQEPVITPNIDRFAAESINFTNSISNYPVCTPYRGMLFTGMYPMQSGIVTNCRSTCPPECHWKPEHVCLSDTLKSAGYSMGYIGKLHLDIPTEEDAVYGEGPRPDGVVWDAYTSPERRHHFDYWYSYGCCDNHNQPHYWTGNAPVSEPIQVHEWSTIHETDVAINYLHNTEEQRDPDQPFALFVAYNPPHMPFNQVPEKYLEYYKDKSPEELLTSPSLTEKGFALAAPHVKNYFAMITGVDDQFGRILDTLAETGLDEDTIVIFTSDHGEMMGDHGLMHKSVWYENSLRVPFIMRLPDGYGAGTNSDLLFGAPDLHATLLGLLDCQDMIPDSVQGKDISQTILTGSGPTLESVPCMVLEGPGKLGVRTKRHTFAINSEDDELKYYLFDNIEDPYQLKNIASESPETVQKLTGELYRHLQITGNPWPDKKL
jgi:arylsulfatase A-like enzyme